MDSVNVNFSVNNIPQMDRHQSEIHRTPIVHQDQNARTAEKEADMRMTMPVEADEVENKNVDPDDKKEQKRSRQDAKKRPGKQLPPDEPPPDVVGPFSVDVQA